MWPADRRRKIFLNFDIIISTVLEVDSLMNRIRLSFKNQVQITVLSQVKVASTQHRISYSEVRTYLRVVKVRSKKEWDRINPEYQWKLLKGAFDDKIKYFL